MVPPYGSMQGGSTATIEYAMAVLNVPHIIVCGHTDCAVMKALLNPEGVSDLPAFREWGGLDEVCLSRRPDLVKFLAEHFACLVALNLARIAAERAAGQIGALSSEIPKGLAPARETRSGVFSGVKRKFDSDPHRSIFSLYFGESEGSFR